MLNVVALMGRLTADPELRYTPSNLPVATFTIAVERTYVKQGEQRQADFIDIVAWRATAEFVSRYFRKGQLVAVNGSIQTRSYEDPCSCLLQSCSQRVSERHPALHHVGQGSRPANPAATGNPAEA